MYSHVDLIAETLCLAEFQLIFNEVHYWLDKWFLLWRLWRLAVAIYITYNENYYIYSKRFFLSSVYTRD